MKKIKKPKKKPNFKKLTLYKEYKSFSVIDRDAIISHANKIKKSAEEYIKSNKFPKSEINSFLIQEIMDLTAEYLSFLDDCNNELNAYKTINEYTIFDSEFNKFIAEVSYFYMSLCETLSRLVDYAEEDFLVGLLESLSNKVPGRIERLKKSIADAHLNQIPGPSVLQ